MSNSIELVRWLPDVGDYRVARMRHTKCPSGWPSLFWESKLETPVEFDIFGLNTVWRRTDTGMRMPTWIETYMAEQSAKRSFDEACADRVESNPSRPPPSTPPNPGGKP